MKTAKEMNDIAIAVAIEREEADKKRAIEYADTVLMELIEGEAKRGYHQISVTKPKEFSFRFLREYLTANGYSIGAAFQTTFTIHW